MTRIALGRIAGTAFGALSLAALALEPVGAQGVDARWQAWTGCWAPVALGGVMPSTTGTTLCVVPAAGTSAVEVVTIVGGKVEDRTRIEADGIAHPVSRDGCTGTETATWARIGTRVYLASDLTCVGGLKRQGKGVMSFSQRYEWLEVRGVQSGDASGVAVSRYAALSDNSKLPAEIASLVHARGAAANNAILVAASPMTLADIADVSLRVDSGVAATWLVERTADVKLTITGKQLASLADQGVPGAVIDVLVALAHPRVFALDANTREAEFKQQTQGAGSGNQYAYRGLYGNPHYYGWMSSSMTYGMYSPFYYGMSDPLYGYGFRYGGYGYGAGGYGSYSPYYGYYPGSQPIIVVTRGGEGTGVTAQPHGRVTKGQGYTQGKSSGGSSGSSSGSASSSPSSSSGSSSAGSTGGAASSGSASSGGDRTAVRKPPQ